jgi:hypothetical protein
MPYDFAQKLYGATKTGLTVVVSDEQQFPGTVVNPGLVAPVDLKGAPVSEPTVLTSIYWQPEAAPDGPVTILVTSADRRISVFRAGVEIGRASFTIKDPAYPITLHVLTMLEPSGVGPLDPVTGRPVPRWLMVSGDQEDTVSTDQLLEIFDVPPEFLTKAATVVGPGTTMVITRPAATQATTTAAAADFTVVTAEEPVEK